jgi:DNA invertase Pin-like site-specific DNA recombinase
MTIIKSNLVDKLCNKLSKSQLIEKAIIYARLSIKGQQIGTSIESQIKNCQDYCDAKGYKVLDTCVDYGSAKNLDKQVNLKSILDIHKSINLVVNEVDRLSRNPLSYAIIQDTCEKKNITIHFVEDGLISNNTVDLKSISSKVIDGQIESKRIGDRVRRSIGFRKNNGTYTKVKKSYGFKYNKETKQYEKNEDYRIVELIQKIHNGSDLKEVEKIVKQITGKKVPLCFVDGEDDEGDTTIEYGNMNYSEIARFLNTIPIKRNGKTWRGIHISKIIKNNS